MSVVVWSWVALLGAVLALVGLVLAIPFNPWTDPRRRAADYLNSLWARGVFGVLPGLVITVRGRERMTAPQTPPGPYVICANHSSVADVLLVLKELRGFKVIAKRSLFAVPLMGTQLWLSGHIPASRGEEGGAQRVLERCQAWFRRGSSVLIFPEGTRSPDGRVQRFQQGAFALAKQAGVPILPVAITGTRRIAGKGDFVFCLRSQIRMEILEPVVIAAEESPRAAASRVRARVEQAVERLEREG